MCTDSCARDDLHHPVCTYHGNAFDHDTQAIIKQGNTLIDCALKIILA